MVIGGRFELLDGYEKMLENEFNTCVFFGKHLWICVPDFWVSQTHKSKWQKRSSQRRFVFLFLCISLVTFLTYTRHSWVFA